MSSCILVHLNIIFLISVTKQRRPCARGVACGKLFRKDTAIERVDFLCKNDAATGCRASGSARAARGAPSPQASKQLPARVEASPGGTPLVTTVY